jgi:hypothetical protein
MTEPSGFSVIPFISVELLDPKQSSHSFPWNFWTRDSFDFRRRLNISIGGVSRSDTALAFDSIFFLWHFLTRHSFGFQRRLVTSLDPTRGSLVSLGGVSRPDRPSPFTFSILFRGSPLTRRSFNLPRRLLSIGGVS